MHPETALKAKRRSKKKAATPAKSAHIWEWLLAALLFAGIAGYFLHDALDYPLEFSGSVIWFMALVVTFVLGFGFFAQFLVPAGWQEGLLLLLSFYRNSLSRLFGAPAASAPPAELPASFGTVNAGILDSHIALALARGNAYTRPAGPGYVRLEPLETIRHVIDLRVHLRGQEVKARSRDGIPISTSVSAIFQIQRPAADPPDARLPFPYERDAVFNMTYAASGIDPRSGLLPWHERVAPEAAAMLVAELSRHPLHEIYSSPSPGINPLVAIEDRLKQQMRDRFTPLGIDILSVSVGLLDLPPDVMAQRIQNWQAHRQREIDTQQTEAAAAFVERLNQAQAEVQRDVINKLADSLNAINEKGVDPPKVFTMYILRALEKIVAEDVGEARATRNLVAAITRLRALVDINLSGEEQDGRPPHLPLLE